MPYGLDNYTMLCTFEPDEIECDSDREIDEYSIVSMLVGILDFHTIHLRDTSLKRLHQTKEIYL